MPAATKTSPRSRTRTRQPEMSSLMTLDPLTDTERLVKSTERVRDLGEVFTPAETVQAMLDLLPADIWAPHPSPTWLEPACGDGNFVVAILDRKLARVASDWVAGSLPAGADKDAVRFHALEALASIYGVDLSHENIEGGVPGHEVGARDRLLKHLERWYAKVTSGRLSERSALMRSGRWIVERNILVANMLQTNPDGSSSHREDLPLVEYEWNPAAMTVTVSATTLGAVMDEAAMATTGAMTLFGAAVPTEAWSGVALKLSEAPIDAHTTRVGHTRNGKGKLTGGR